jgi:hypothetical protein
MKTETLKLVYVAYFHSIMSYGIIFWGHSTDIKKVFYIQKKIIRKMAGTKREPFSSSLVTQQPWSGPWLPLRFSL